jgi:hypothetical protein
MVFDATQYQRRGILKMNELSTVQPFQSMAPIQPVQVGNNTATAVAIQQAMAEIQCRYMTARMFPRDIVQVEHKVRLSCERYGVASVAQYALPIGGKAVRGPSIRLAEVLAQCYGNLDIGKEVTGSGNDSEGRYTDIKIFALDLESGVRITETVRCYHYRVSKKDGAVHKTLLTDQGELERSFSMHTSKRLRECIFRVLPRDVIDKAVSWCSQTVQKGDGVKPLLERVKGMVLEYERQGITRSQLEKKVGCAIDLWTPVQFEDMLAIFRSIRDGHASADEFFSDTKQEAATDALASLKAKAAKAAVEKEATTKTQGV